MDDKQSSEVSAIHREATKVIMFLDWCDLIWQNSYDTPVIPLH